MLYYDPYILLSSLHHDLILVHLEFFSIILLEPIAQLLSPRNISVYHLLRKIQTLLN